MNPFDGISNEELESRIASSWDTLNVVLDSLSTNPAMQDGIRRLMTAEDLLSELHAIEKQTPIAAQQILQASIAALVNTQTVRANQSKHTHWPRMRDELFAADWNLLLCSAGELSAVICEHARQTSRKAIDIGALDKAMKDISSSRS